MLSFQRRDAENTEEAQSTPLRVGLRGTRDWGNDRPGGLSYISMRSLRFPLRSLPLCVERHGPFSTGFVEYGKDIPERW
jgi:hypothetical protein